ncbi:hypothetical protein HHI36_020551 [Cryptolaemus montrouzieri]|uniref:C2H2-type domain-containing protein n=1 Tax=Cryptolaemus montrouzieri TaxID=559131 RepID=A0ABD2NB39_9CUCU
MTGNTERGMKKIWDTNEYSETYKEKPTDACEIDLSNIKSELQEECIKVEESETYTNQFIDEARKIPNTGVFIKCENSDIEENESPFKIKAESSEEESTTILHDLIAGEKSFHDSAKEENIDQSETFEDHLNTIDIVLKNNKFNLTDNSKCMEEHVDGEAIGVKSDRCDQCDCQATHKRLANKNYKCCLCGYEASQKVHLMRHINSIHLGIKSHKCGHCNYKATQKGNLIKHIKRVHLGIKHTKYGTFR